MKNLIVLGVLLMVVGGALMVWDRVPVKEKHEATVFGAKLSVTEKHDRKIPVAVSGTILGVGAALTLIGALKKTSR